MLFRKQILRSLFFNTVLDHGTVLIQILHHKLLCFLLTFGIKEHLFTFFIGDVWHVIIYKFSATISTSVPNISTITNMIYFLQVKANNLAKLFSFCFTFSKFSHEGVKTFLFLYYCLTTKSVNYKRAMVFAATQNFHTMHSTFLMPSKQTS